MCWCSAMVRCRQLPHAQSPRRWIGSRLATISPIARLWPLPRGRRARTGRATPAPAADLTLFDSFLPQAWPSGAILALNPPAGSALIAVGQRSAPPASGELARSGALLEGLGLAGVRFGSLRQVQPPAWAATQLA